jgi:hypothetical protein
LHDQGEVTEDCASGQPVAGSRKQAAKGTAQSAGEQHHAEDESQRRTHGEGPWAGPMVFLILDRMFVEEYPLRVVEHEIQCLVQA